MSKEQRTSCIRHLSHSPFITLRKEYHDICEGSYIAAMLLAYFEGWHNHNLRSKAEGSRKTLLQRHTQIDLHDALMGAASKNKIIAAQKLLVDFGFISICERPASETWASKELKDNSNWYLFHVAHVQKAVDELGAKVVDKVKSEAIKPKGKYHANIAESHSLASSQMGQGENNASKSNTPEAKKLPMSQMGQREIQGIEADFSQKEEKGLSQMGQVQSIYIQNKQQYSPSQESNSEQSAKPNFAAAVSSSENIDCQTDKALVNDKQLESADHSQSAAVCSTDVLVSSGSGTPEPDVRPASYAQPLPASEPAPIDQPTQTQPQAVATHLTAPTQPPNKTIGHVISQGQSHVIRQRMIDLAKGGRLGAVSIDDAVLAVERILVDTGQFAAAGDDFAHKLNIVCKQIRERRIDFRPQQAPPKKAEPSREQSIREEIRKLKIERNSAEQARSRGLMAEELCVADINRLNAKIRELESELSQLRVVTPNADTAANCIVHLAERRAAL